MIVHILQASLEAGLRSASKAIPGRTTLPILTNALIRTDEGCVKICATDLEQYLEITIDATVDKPGACCVPLKGFLETIAEIPGGKVTLSQTPSWHLEIRSEIVGFSGRIAVVDSEDFPGAPTGEIEASVEISLPDLKRLNNQVGFAVSTDATRIALNGICLRKVYTHIEAVATDGHRLSRLNLPDAVASNGECWIIPPDATRLAETLCSESEEPIQLRMIPAAAFFEIPAASPFLSATVWTKLVEGPYPQYQQVIPKATAWSATFAREDLIRTAKRIRAVAKNSTDCPTINFDQISGASLVRLSGSSTTRGSEGCENLPATISGEMSPIAWNGNFLLEILGLITSQRVTIRGNKSTQAAIIEPDEDKPALLTILMPVRRHDQ